MRPTASSRLRGVTVPGAGWCHVRRWLALIGAGAPLPASAADVTYLPPAMGVDFSAGWAGRSERSNLIEAGEVVGGRVVSNHDLLIRAEFAPIDQVSAWVMFDATVASRLGFVDPLLMTYDPLTGAGTYIGGPALDPAPEWTGAGLDGVWFGAAAAPFGERFGRGDQATWRLDAAFRTPGRTMWSDGGASARGAAPGGVGWWFGGAFSSRLERSEPYVTMRWRGEGRKTVDVTDVEGAVLAADVVVKAPHRVDVRAGIEAITGENERLGTGFAVDLHVGWSYVAWQDAPSGFLLPSVLPASFGLASTASEHVEGRVGGGFVGSVASNVRLRIGGDYVIVTPWRVDSAYAVRAGVGQAIEGEARLTVGYR